MAKTARPVPEGFHSLTAALTLDNAAQTIEWYKNAFGAQEVSRHVGPDGKIVHALLRIGDSPLMMNDAMMGTKGPRAYGGAAVALWLYVDNCDAVFNRAVDAGAKVQVPMADQFWGDRGGAITDPEGFTWWIATHKEELTPAELEQRSKDFFKQMASETH